MRHKWEWGTSGAGGSKGNTAVTLNAEERDDGPGDAHVAEEIDLEHFVNVSVASCMSAQLFFNSSMPKQRHPSYSSRGTSRMKSMSSEIGVGYALRLLSALHRRHAGIVYEHIDVTKKKPTPA